MTRTKAGIPHRFLHLIFTVRTYTLSTYNSHSKSREIRGGESVSFRDNSDIHTDPVILATSHHIAT